MRTQVTERLGNGLAGWIGGLFGGGSSASTQSGNIGFGTGENLADALVTNDGKIHKIHPDDNALFFQGDPAKKLPGNTANVQFNMEVINETGAKVDVQQTRNATGGRDIKMMIFNANDEYFNSGRGGS